MPNSSKYISQLINSHKISLILVPLIEAVEINKRSGSIHGLKVSDLLRHVIEVGGEIYQELLEKNDQIVDTGLVADKLFITLSKSLRNSIILYNLPSLSLMKDDILEMFDENSEFIQKYQNKTEKSINGGVGGKQNIKEISEQGQESMDHALSSLSQLFMPVWIFHTNLYTSGVINDVKIVELNKRVANYLIKVLDKLISKANESHGKYKDEFKTNSIFICSEMCAGVVFEFHSKLIKNRTELDAYITSPEKVLSRLLPALYANFTILNDTLESAIVDFMNK